MTPAKGSKWIWTVKRIITTVMRPTSLNESLKELIFLLLSWDREVKWNEPEKWLFSLAYHNNNTICIFSHWNLFFFLVRSEHKIYIVITDCKDILWVLMVEEEQQNCMVNVHIKWKVLSFAKSIAKRRLSW